MIEKIVARLVTESFDIKCRALDERLERAYGVNPSQEAAHPFERVRVLELRRAPAAAWVYGDAVAAAFVQRAFVGEHQGGDDRKLASCKLDYECVLFEDLGVAPAARPVELGDQRLVILDAELVDAVLVAVQRLQPAVGAQARALQRIEHRVGSQPRIGRVFAVRKGVLWHGADSKVMSGRRQAIATKCYEM